MEDKIKVLIRSRGIVKSAFTTLDNFVNSWEDGNEIEQLEVRLTLLQDNWKKFNDIQDELDLLQEDVLSDDERASVEDRYCSLLSFIEGRLKKRQEQQIRNTGEPVVRVKLPQLCLPQFSGNLSEWVDFKDTFLSLVGNNSAVQNVQKFHYLLSAVHSDARRVVQHIPLSEDGYDIAWNLLTERYQNEKLIVNTHIANILRQPTILTENVAQIRQLIDITKSNLKALQRMNQKTNAWDSIIIFIIVQKLENKTKREWELHTPSKELPTLNQLYDFLETRCNAIEASSKRSEQRLSIQVKPQSSYVATRDSCMMCRGEHDIHNCIQFKQLEVEDRYQFAKKNKLCLNCLGKNHYVSQCSSRGCMSCDRYHHTLLHKTEDAMQTSYFTMKGTVSSHILLGTVQVRVMDNTGRLRNCYALLDSGSQLNFITSACCNRLGLRKRRSEVPIKGISNSVATTTHMTLVEIFSNVSDYNTKVTCLILPQVTGKMPSVCINTSQWNIPTNIQLADDKFNKPHDIDILLGAETFFDVLQDGKYQCQGLPVLQNTSFGYIVSGAVPEGDIQGKGNSKRHVFMGYTDPLHIQLEKFWSLEDLNHKVLTAEEKECERHFQENAVRMKDGRYQVRLPLRKDRVTLGESYDTAKTRLQQLERRLEKQPQLKEDYKGFLREYMQLNHMSLIQETEAAQEYSIPPYYLPHHAVIKEDSSTTKLRVVFNGSERTSNGFSLNDLLMVGASHQEDICSIVLRFRLHNIVFCADIAKMYRQILIDPRDAHLQRILWREERDQPMKIYELRTVTYGTSSAPFLATRCLKKLAEDEGERFRKALEVLIRDFYVDDLISGADNINDALQLQEDLIQMLKSGGFWLRKWTSNHPRLLERIPLDDIELKSPLEFGTGDTVKTLGLLWSPKDDRFMICTQIKHCTRITKRTILGTIAAIFDPLGLLSPVILKCKVLMQKLWLEKLGWDDSLPAHIQEEWHSIQGNLQVINTIAIERQVTCKKPAQDWQLHGFCDASEVAYGGCIYLRTQDEEDNVTIRLLCSKSRVAPLKQRSIPRLELCGALLLSQMVVRTVKALRIDSLVVHLWTDSTVVLTWLQSRPSRWKPFVGNRVAEIQELSIIENWNHISTKDNPADLISRGTDPLTLKHSALWWHGPKWLFMKSCEWPITWSNKENDKAKIEERNCSKEGFGLVSLVCQTVSEQLLPRCSSWLKLRRVVAFCIRFTRNCRNLNYKRSGALSVEEINEATVVLLREIQGEMYLQDIEDLKNNGMITKGSSLKTLNPFLDEGQLLRVGGRLNNSPLNFEQKHPVILSTKHDATRLIIEETHRNNAHASGQLLLALVRQKYWITNPRSLIRRIVFQCLICARLRATTSTQLMGQLPKTRVTISRPFTATGVDYCGPFFIKQGSSRRNTRFKCYICLFVCLATKAIHIELVTDLSSQAFIAALRRFTSRRGLCSHLYSDNGTNFVGAQRELKKCLTDATFKEELQNYSAQRGIEFHFIPPSSPHMGGLWEAGIKSIKFHLRRVVGLTCLTFEEFYTVLCQIEACLNSRPLIALTNDPENIDVLTPGHFLIGTSLLSPPNSDLTDLNPRYLSRWKRVQVLTQQFWKRWSVEYLNQLQQRHKWKNVHPNMMIGTVVLIKEDNQPPLVWKKGIVIDVHPGEDNLIRVVTVKTNKGILKRPIQKLCVLPCSD